MHESVPKAWVTFNTPLEGMFRGMYPDVKGLITTGMGNLIDPLPYALALPWELPGGIPCPKETTSFAFHELKKDPRCKTHSAKFFLALPYNNMRLSMAEVEKLIVGKLEQNDTAMKKRFADWEDRPADAQLAVHSMAWAMGPAFFAKFPKFTKAFMAKDYLAACRPVGKWPWGDTKYECDMKPDVDDDGQPTGTIPERNRRSRQLLTNAAYVKDDIGELRWGIPKMS